MVEVLAEGWRGGRSGCNIKIQPRDARTISPFGIYKLQKINSQMILKSLPFLLQLGSLLFLPLHTPIVTGTVSLSTMVPSSSVPLSSTSSSSAAIVTPSSSSYLPLHVLKPLDASEPKHIGEFSDTSSLTVFYPPGRNASLR